MARTLRVRVYRTWEHPLPTDKEVIAFTKTMHAFGRVFEGKFHPTNSTQEWDLDEILSWMDVPDVFPPSLLDNLREDMPKDMTSEELYVELFV